MEDTKFKKGQIPYNKGIKKKLDLDKIYKEHIEGKSILDISKRLGVSDRLIRIRLKEKGYDIRSKLEPTKYTRDKISNTLKRKGIQPKQRYSGEVWNKGLDINDERVKNNIRGLLKARKYQVIPFKDSSIEVKIQDFLKELNISFLTHQYMEIEHGYQCDILIPSMNLIIECDGNYWHNYPYGKEIDKIRTKELKENGYKIIRLWETEINILTLEKFRDMIISLT
jgi:G:T-mismatch repair DNA endonuclease (very short patch repair protein)